jgi:hypothetical protein
VLPEAMTTNPGMGSWDLFLRTTIDHRCGAEGDDPRERWIMDRRPSLRLASVSPQEKTHKCPDKRKS